jgi:NitT/TauT family transport system permease protein
MRAGAAPTGLPLAAARLGIVALALTTWQLISGPLVDPLFISNPVSIAARLWSWIETGFLSFHLAVTLQEAFLGFVVGTVAGIAAGTALGSFPYMSKLVDPLVIALASLPEIALAPIFILWFGTGMEMKVMLAASIVFFYVFWSTFAGARDVDRELVDALRVMGARPRHLLSKVVGPSALTWVYLGLKVSIPHAMVGAVIGELLAGDRGIGYVLLLSTYQLDSAGVMAGAVVLMLVSVSFNELLTRSERHVLRWKRPSRL